MNLHSRARAAMLTALFLLAHLLATSGQAQNAEIRDLATKMSAKNSEVFALYKAINFNPIWNQVNLRELSTFLRGLDAHGLSPQLFQLDGWEQVWFNPAGFPASVEVETSHLALFAIQALAYGFVDPREVHPKWELFGRTVSSSQFLQAALQQSPGQLAAFLLDRVPPKDPRYQDMVKALSRYRSEILRHGGWKALSQSNRPVAVGLEYKDVNLLRARLIAERDLPDGHTFSTRRKDRFIYDDLTSKALKSFQFRHGIDPDGDLGPATIKELNHPAEDRVSTLVINLDRLRWLPRAYEKSEHVEVNIAEGALRVYDQSQLLTTMKVVVGVKGKFQTPVFHGDMKYLIFRPYWNVPHGIARNELIPEALKTGVESYFQRFHYQIVRGYNDLPSQVLPVTVENVNKVAAGGLLMRQADGTHNSMGLVKFIFPNDNSVYLHDTTSENKKLFEATDRDFSHGCVRVSNPSQLAEIVLRANGGWDPSRVMQAMEDAANPNTRVDLVKPMPVYLMYWTAFIMGDGRLRFDQDIYGHDIYMKQRFGLLPQTAPQPEPPVQGAISSVQ